MFGQYFYHAVTRRFITVFGTLFNDLHIQRVRDDTTVQDVKVPMAYGSYDKMIARLNGDPNLDRQVAAISPAISFVMGPPKYDADRKLQSTLQRCVKTDNGTKTQYMGVPYNFDVTLYIYAKEEEDGLKILEQILPYFTPSLTVTVVLDDELDYKMDVPIVIGDITYEDEHNWGKFTDRRYLIWEIKFLMKGEFAGPISPDTKPLIKVVHANIDSLISNAEYEEVRVQPGLTANGEPTTDANSSISPYDINPDDNYDYVVQIIPGNDPPT